MDEERNGGKYISYKSFLIGILGTIISLFFIGGSIASSIFYKKSDGVRLEEGVKRIEDKIDFIIKIYEQKSRK